VLHELPSGPRRARTRTGSVGGAVEPRWQRNRHREYDGGRSAVFGAASEPRRRGNRSEARAHELGLGGSGRWLGRRGDLALFPSVHQNQCRGRAADRQNHCRNRQPARTSARSRFPARRAELDLPRDIIGQIGGGEVVVVCPEVDGEPEVVAEPRSTAMAEPFTLASGSAIEVGMSILLAPRAARTGGKGAIQLGPMSGNDVR
jgi:hypothetical protein